MVASEKSDRTCGLAVRGVDEAVTWWLVSRPMGTRQARSRRFELGGGGVFPGAGGGLGLVEVEARGRDKTSIS